MSLATPENFVWTPVGADRFEHVQGRKVARVEAAAHFAHPPDAWRATIALVDGAPGNLLEMIWLPDRRAAFGWCGARLRPDASADDLTHLIGETTP